MTYFHGSTENLELIAKGSCVSPDADYAVKYAKGEVGGSKGFQKSPGWIYVLEVSSDYVDGEKLLADVVPVRRISAEEHLSASIDLLLYGNDEPA